MSETMVDLSSANPLYTEAIAHLRSCGYTKFAASSVCDLSLLTPAHKLALLLESGVLGNSIVLAAWDHLRGIGRKFGLRPRAWKKGNCGQPAHYNFAILAYQIGTTAKSKLREELGVERTIELEDVFANLASSLEDHFILAAVRKMCELVEERDHGTDSRPDCSSRSLCSLLLP